MDKKAVKKVIVWDGNEYTMYSKLYRDIGLKTSYANFCRLMRNNEDDVDKVIKHVEVGEDAQEKEDREFERLLDNFDKICEKHNIKYKSKFYDKICFCKNEKEAIKLYNDDIGKTAKKQKKKVDVTAILASGKLTVTELRIALNTQYKVLVTDKAKQLAKLEGKRINPEILGMDTDKTILKLLNDNLTKEQLKLLISVMSTLNKNYNIGIRLGKALVYVRKADDSNCSNIQDYNDLALYTLYKMYTEGR